MRVAVWQHPATRKLPVPIIEVAWRHVGEEGKIHYRAKRPDGTNRRLIAREGDGLYELLEQHLAARRPSRLSAQSGS